MGRVSCLQESARVHHSVVGLRSWIAEGALVEDTLLMGADYYEVGALLFVFERF
jgi:ADP-glucose pyrophosphorylase